MTQINVFKYFLIITLIFEEFNVHKMKFVFIKINVYIHLNP